MSETPTPKNVDSSLASEATDQVTTPMIEPEARNPEAGDATASESTASESTAAESTDRRVAAAKKSELSREDPEPATGDPQPQQKVSKPAAKDVKPADQETKPAAKDAKPADQETKPAAKNVKPADQESKPAAKDAKPAPKPKPQKPEDKPFPEFIDALFLPAVVEQLKSHNITAERLERVDGDRPVVGGSCPMVIGELPGGRRFWLCFAKADINSQKVIALADPGSEPTLLESFLIDEKRMSLPLLVSRLLQRLNGQKWLGSN